MKIYRENKHEHGPIICEGCSNWGDETYIVIETIYSRLEFCPTCFHKLKNLLKEDD